MTNFIGGKKVFNDGEQAVANYAWDTTTLQWVPLQQVFSGDPAANVNVLNSSLPVTQSGTWNIASLTGHTAAATPISVRLSDGSSFYTAGGGGSSGTEYAEGSTQASPTGTLFLGQDSGDVVRSILTDTSGRVAVNVNGTVPVSGTFWQATQPVSIAGALTVNSHAVTNAGTFAVQVSSALPTGANTIGSVAVNKTALTPSSPATSTVGTSTALIVASNASRKGLVITNLSNATISFGLGASAVINSGITLTPYGTWVMDEYTFTTAAVNAIASAASSALSVQEFA